MLPSVVEMDFPLGIRLRLGFFWGFNMKKLTFLMLVLAVIFSSANVMAAKKVKDECTTIPQGGLFGSDGVEIATGFDVWGYNYQAHLFNGGYCDAYRDAVWCQPYVDINLSMKWNDAWLSNKDCDDDGLLDRHFGYESYIGSGAWITNHQSGEYPGEDGNTCNWVYFIKIVAAPADAYEENGYWFTADGDEIGPVIWGSFAIIQTISNDTCAGEHGVQYKSPVGPGLGNW